MFLVLSSTAPQESGTDAGGIAPWVYVVVYAAFAVQGVALAVAFGCYVRARWGPALGERTGDVLARPTAQSWLRGHLAKLAEIVALMTLAVGVVCAYWAAGGSIGLSEARPHDSLAMHASRSVGAVVAAAGLLGLAGRWGREQAVLAAGSTRLGRLRCPDCVRRADGCAQPAVLDVPNDTPRGGLGSDRLRPGA